MNLFNEVIRKAWWETFSQLIADGVLHAGEEYMVEDDLFFISFLPCHTAYVRYIIQKGKPREWLLPPAQMRKLLMTEKEYLYDLRKRFSEVHNIRCAVFLWNKQVRLPPKRLRKVS